MDSTLQGAFVGAVATILAAGIGYFALRKPQNERVMITVLPDRVAAFKKARDLIESAKTAVIDTTWGNSEENFLPAEKAALGEYLSAKAGAVKSSKLDYREIYTEAPEDDQRRIRIEAEQSRSSPLEKYSAKLLGGLDPSFPMIDFLIVDGSKCVLSCLSKDVAKPDHHHLFVESVELASFLTQYFQICWDKAATLRPKETLSRGGSDSAA